MKILIIEDEPLAQTELLRLLKKTGYEFRVEAMLDSVEDSVEWFRSNPEPDLVFLDIEMPHMNGFEMLSELPLIDFQVIFITAYDEYAVKAFEINACDYLLKPVDNEMLSKALVRFQELRNTQDISKRLEGLFEAMQKRNNSFYKLALSTLEGLEFVKIDEIVRCESSSNYTFVHTSDGQKRLVSKTLGSIQESLEGNNFYRIHKSHLVNIAFIHKYIRGKTGHVILDNGTHIPVSRSKKDFLEEMK